MSEQPSILGALVRRPKVKILSLRRGNTHLDPLFSDVSSSLQKLLGQGWSETHWRPPAVPELWNEGKKSLLMSVQSQGFDTCPCYFWLQGHAFKSSGLTLKQMCLLRYLPRFIINSRAQFCFLSRTASLFIAFHLQTAVICMWVEFCFLKQRREGKKKSV